MLCIFVRKTKKKVSIRAEAREGGVELLRATRDAYEAAYDVLPAGAGDDESFAHISAFLRAVLPSP